MREQAAPRAAESGGTQAARVFEVRTASVEETEALGKRLGADLAGGQLVLLTGPLGAGKTAFVRGVVAGAGSPSAVSSPTFILEHHYTGPLPLLHVDLYRLMAVDVADLAIDDMLAAGGCVLVEWGERLPDSYRSDAIRVEFALDALDDDARIIRISDPRV